jgi:predicted DNA-binding protein (MmcQ/YjbR family)
MARLGHRGWVGVVLDTKPDWRLVAELVEESYRLVAHPRLVRKLDEAST